MQRQVLQSVLSSQSGHARALGAIAVLALGLTTVEVFSSGRSDLDNHHSDTGVVVYRELPTCPRPARFSWDSVTGIWRFAGGVMTITLLSLLLTQADKICSHDYCVKRFAITPSPGAYGALYMLSTRSVRHSIRPLRNS